MMLVVPLAACSGQNVTAMDAGAGGSLGTRADNMFASTDVTGIAFDPPLGTVYVADSDKVHAFWLDYGTGMLSEQPGSPHALP